MGVTKVSDGLGRWGEDVAAAWLREAGMQVMDTRWRHREGELDLVARDGKVIVFAEVKTRSSLGFGAPLEAITPAKQRRIRRLAVAWLDEHNQHADDLRFDVVGVLRTPAGPEVEHIRAAF